MNYKSTNNLLNACECRYIGYMGYTGYIGNAEDALIGFVNWKKSKSML